MYKSVIEFGYFGGYQTMLIPKIIGTYKAGYAYIRRLDRLLEVGHRLRGDILV